jgi:transcriptional regulator with XRE-family HTH domain
MINFGGIIKKYRDVNNLTQVDLANKIKITSTYLSAIENNRKEPSLALISEISQLLRIPKEVLVWEAVEINQKMSAQDKKVIDTAKSIMKAYLMAYDKDKEKDKN